MSAQTAATIAAIAAVLAVMVSVFGLMVGVLNVFLTSWLDAQTTRLAGAVSRYLPHQRDELHLSFALADPQILERIFVLAGFQDVQVQRETGQLPQAYLQIGTRSTVVARVLSLLPLHPGQRPEHLPDSLRDQVVGVLHRPPAGLNCPMAA